MEATPDDAYDLALDAILDRTRRQGGLAITIGDLEMELGAIEDVAATADMGAHTNRALVQEILDGN